MDEKMRILKMLEEGKITAEEAGKLIAALDETEPVIGQEQTGLLYVKEDYDKRMLRVIVEGPDTVRVNFPIRLAKKILRVTGRLPIKGVESMGDINMQELMDTIVSCLDDEMLGEIVSVDTQDGEKVRIVIE